MKMITEGGKYSVVVSRVDTVRAELAQKGITGKAADEIIRKTAKDRHAERVLAAKNVAKIYCDAVADGPSEKIFQYTVLCADFWFAGSMRHTGLELLGKGRRQATDGKYWTAAILDAARELRAEMEAEDGFVDFNWTVEDGDLNITATQQVGESVYYVDYPVVDFIEEGFALKILNGISRYNAGLPNYQDEIQGLPGYKKEE